MASPAKRRKIKEDSKSSPAGSRNLDYFFGKQKKDAPVRPTQGGDVGQAESDNASELTDEQLARKLQEQWDQEAAGLSNRPPEASNGSMSMGNEKVDTINETVEEAMESESLSIAEQLTDPVHGIITSKPSNFLAGTASNPNVTKKNTLTLQSTGSAEDQISSSIPFDESPLTFDPQRYVPDLKKYWMAETGDASYSILTRCFVLVNSTQSRIKIVDTLVNMLRTIIEGDPSSLLPTVRLLFRHYLLQSFPGHFCRCY